MIIVAKLTRLTHIIAIQLQLVTESCTICSSRSRRAVRKLLDTPYYDKERTLKVVVVAYFKTHSWYSNSEIQVTQDSSFRGQDMKSVPVEYERDILVVNYPLLLVYMAIYK